MKSQKFVTDSGTLIFNGDVFLLLFYYEKGEKERKFDITETRRNSERRRKGEKRKSNLETKN